MKIQRQEVVIIINLAIEGFDCVQARNINAKEIEDVPVMNLFWILEG